MLHPGAPMAQPPPPPPEGSVVVAEDLPVVGEDQVRPLTLGREGTVPAAAVAPARHEEDEFRSLPAEGAARGDVPLVGILHSRRIGVAGNQGMRRVPAM